MLESKTDELSQLIECFDIVNNLFEQSQSEAEIEKIPDIHLQTPIHSRIENLNIGVTDEKDILKDFINCTNNSTTLESHNLSEVFNLKEEFLSSKPCHVNNTYEVCIENYDELELTSEKGHNRNISGISKLGVSCIHSKTRSQASDKSIMTCEVDIDVTSENYNSNQSEVVLKRSKTEKDYCSKHQSSSILKVMKRNSITKMESLLPEDLDLNIDNKCSHDIVNCEASYCRPKLLKQSLTKSKKKKD